MKKLRTIATILLTVPILYAATPLTNKTDNIYIPTNNFNSASITNSMDRAYDSMDNLYKTLCKLSTSTNNPLTISELEAVANKPDIIKDLLKEIKENTDPDLLEGKLQETSRYQSTNPDLDTEIPIKKTIRDDYHKKVGEVKTKKTETYDRAGKLIATGSKSILYDKNGNKIASVHRIGNNTVYRVFENPKDKRGKRISRKEAKELGLRD